MIVFIAGNLKGQALEDLYNEEQNDTNSYINDNYGSGFVMYNPYRITRLNALRLLENSEYVIKVDNSEEANFFENVANFLGIEVDKTKVAKNE